MAKIKVTSKYALYDGMSITFKAPCNSEDVDGLKVYYLGDVSEFTFRDALKNDFAEIKNLFSADSYVKVVLDTTNNYAYIQNSVPSPSSIAISNESAAALGMENASLEDVINGMIMISGTLPPTAETVGAIGQCYWNSQTNILYKCTRIDDTGYTWTTIAGGTPKFSQGPIMITESQTVDLTQYGLSVGDQINVVVVGGGGGGGSNTKNSGGNAGLTAPASDGNSGIGGGGYGAGGGGASSFTEYRKSDGNEYYYQAGGGGGGGHLASQTITLTDTTVEVIVGKGGYGGNTAENTSTSGTAGGASSFGNYLTAEGGAGGTGGGGNNRSWNSISAGKGGSGGHNGGNGGAGTEINYGSKHGAGGGGGGGWVIESATSAFGTDGTDGESGSNAGNGASGVGGTSGYAGSGDGVVLFWY